MAKLTQAGFVVGTPEYMAPEMATGKEAVDGRADIYALGCLAYWLLCGRGPFESDSSLKILYAHLQDEPPKLSDLSRHTIPLDFASVIECCMAKDPDDRPQTAAELGQLLRNCDCFNDWGQEEARDWWEKI